MIFQPLKDSRIPVYVQLKQYFLDMIDRGYLGPGTQLPPTRRLAGKLGLSRSTVVIAYQELEASGVITSHVGRGSFVSNYHRTSSRRQNGMEIQLIDWKNYIASAWRSGAAEQMVDFVDHNGTAKAEYSLAIASPIPENYPLTDLKKNFRQALQEYKTELFRMGPAEGFAPFIEQISVLMLKRGVRVDQDSVIVTNGVQQGIDLIARVLLQPGDIVILEDPTYPGAIACFRSYGARLIGIPTDTDGMDVEALEQQLKKYHPKLIYVVPTFHNPTGAVMPFERRKKLVELALHYEIPVIEDDYVNELRYEDQYIVPLKSLDTGGIVMHLGSLSKLLHGIRIGWIVAPQAIARNIMAARRLNDVECPILLQAAMREFFKTGRFDHFLKRQRRLCWVRRDIMVDSLGRYVPKSVSVHPARGGCFQYLELPNTVVASQLLKRARMRGLAFLPRRTFNVEGSQDNGIRLAFVGPGVEEIKNGAKILGSLIQEIANDNR